MAGDAKLLFIIGSGDDDDQIREVGSRILVAGTSDLGKVLLERVPHHRLHLSRNYFRQGKQADLSGYSTIVNLITEPERNVKVLEILRKLLRGVNARVINRPETVMRSSRDHVAKLLDGIPGLIAPKAVRLEGGKPALASKALERSGIVAPIILRKTGTHTGKIVGLFDSIEETVAALGPGEHIATRFVDFVSADGRYRKFRVFFIGDRVILRHMFVSDTWNVHVKDRLRFMAHHPDYVAEERRLFDMGEPFSPAVREVFKAIRGRMTLDFFGMDFGMTQNGEVVLFEANATMSFFPLWPTQDPQFVYLTKCLHPATDAFRELLGLPPDVSPAARVELQGL